ncbi:hypothetical protein RAMLITH_01665 [Ramlibacter sp. RBP-2]|uniref:DUF6950 domain-containing protein n=1 Tax=Ramlibacter lithotrophicus TaxID=2606681 RepID=A0A7X6DC88_9BURK|nr:hypothetical protein [Ramlibacter lithotrophicus]NKE64514.1 hypothetical protein [Ramlibacter lithotrophicus]
MKRLHDWQLRLAEFARERQDMPFAWGVNDCFLFSADAVMAVTGYDMAAGLRGTYSDERQAGRILRERGGLAALVDSQLGERVPPLMANVGDIVLLDMGNHPAVGVCNGTSLLGPGAGGMVACGMGFAKAAWRVG